MDAGAWGLSTSFLDSDKQGRPVPSRAADMAEFDALFDVIQRPDTGWWRSCPACSARSPEVLLEDLARRCGARGIPLTWTGFTYTDSNPAGTQRWIDLARKLKAEGIGFYPQLSPRSVDFRLNWDSSMMFMSMPQGWHKVIAARGAERRRCSTDPAWRTAAREEWDRTEKALFPHRRLDKVRFVEVTGADNQPWLGRTLAELVDERGGHPSDVFADFVLANDCHPGVVAVGVSNAESRGGAHPRRPRRARQLLRRRSPHADAVRLGRHHAAADPPRPRAR